MTQPVTGDRVTAALVAAMEQMVNGIGGGAFLRRQGDAAILVSGVPFATMNGVLIMRTTASAREIGDLLDDPALQSIVHSVQMRPNCPPEVADLVAGRGMHEEETIPLMALATPSGMLETAAGLDSMTIRTLDPAEARLHGAMAADAFGVPVEVFDTFAKPQVLGEPGVRTYVGSVAGVDVTTALSVRGGDYVGIFDVATPSAHRGHGYGSAITARATLDGFASGASFAFLQSSELGFGAYERLGFRTLEEWPVWVSPVSLSRS